MKDVLVTRRKAIRLALDGDLSLLRQIQQESSGDAADFALDATHDEISSQLAELEAQELGQIETALQLFEEGVYGKCLACQTNIPLARLQALPYAPCCIACQRLAEQNNGTIPLAADGSLDDVRVNDVDFNVS